MSEDTISNKPQQSLSTGVARQLATTTKTTPLMEKITPRCLLKLLPWVHVGSGTYRVNRRKVVLKSQKIEISEKNGKVTVRPEHLLSVAYFKDVDASLIESMAKSLVRPIWMSFFHACGRSQPFSWPTQGRLPLSGGNVRGGVFRRE